MDVEAMWDFLLDYGIATDEEIQLVTDINGYKESTLEDILYVRTGYHNFDQCKEEFLEE